MQITTKHVLTVLHVLAWIIFIGLALQAGIIIVNAILLFVVSPANHDKLWSEIDLRSLFNYNKSYFISHVTAIIIVALAKALIFYFIIKISNDKRLSLAKPFGEPGRKIMQLVAYFSLIIGLFAGGAAKHNEWLIEKGVQMPSAALQHIDGADVWIFMGIVVFVLAKIFKRGAEIQSEHELTI
ncbi:MAG: DUF2975 domain-containing protein [Chitinophagaceae bacterium]|nr:MAG: DUF2975 domain-containing protein [Chitinophagaceae bacterium]